MARIGYGSSFGMLLGLATIVLGGLFAYKSVAHVKVLRPEPPAEFLDAKRTWNKKQRVAEDRLGRAYWDVARTISRATIHFGDRLPEEPPPLFSVDSELYPSTIESSSAARRRYWRNLGKVWNNPAAWESTYEWHTGWLRGLSY